MWSSTRTSTRSRSRLCSVKTRASFSPCRARRHRLRHGLRRLALETMRPLVALVALLIAAASALAADAWQAEWERTKAAAEKEGEVVYYTLGDDYNYVKEFEKRFPKIKVKIVPGRGVELLSRVMAERRAGKYLADVARL